MSYKTSCTAQPLLQHIVMATSFQSVPWVTAGLIFIATKKLSQLTEDQSAVWSLYKDGSITKEELRQHPRNHILLQAIGSNEVLEASDIFSCEEKLNTGDILMLCSDGLSDMAGDADIEKVLTQQSFIEEKADRLVDMANENGGKDNIELAPTLRVVMLFHTRFNATQTIAIACPAAA